MRWLMFESYRDWHSSNTARCGCPSRSRTSQTRSAMRRSRLRPVAIHSWGKASIRDRSGSSPDGQFRYGIRARATIRWRKTALTRASNWLGVRRWDMGLNSGRGASQGHRAGFSGPAPAHDIVLRVGAYAATGRAQERPPARPRTDSGARQGLHRGRNRSSDPIGWDAADRSARSRFPGAVPVPWKPPAGGPVHVNAAQVRLKILFPSCKIFTQSTSYGFGGDKIALNKQFPSGVQPLA